MNEYDRERHDALVQESLTQGEYMNAAHQQYAADEGQYRPDQAWILSPTDVWMPNPYYQGEPVPHPEDDDLCDGIYTVMVDQDTEPEPFDYENDDNVPF